MDTVYEEFSIYFQSHIFNEEKFTGIVPIYVWAMLWLEYKYPGKRGPERMDFVKMHAIPSGRINEKNEVVRTEPYEYQDSFDGRHVFLDRVVCQCPICSLGKNRLLQ